MVQCRVQRGKGSGKEEAGPEPAGSCVNVHVSPPGSKDFEHFFVLKMLKGCELSTDDMFAGFHHPLQTCHTTL